MASADRLDPPFRLRSRELAGAATVAAFLAAAFLAPIFSRLGYWGIEDWDYWAAHHEAARLTLLGFAQVPQWNPWICGGTDIAAHPGSRVFALSAPLFLWLGATLAMKLEILLHAIVGQLGLYAAGREIGLDRISAWLAPIVYFLGSFYALPVSAGIIWYTTLAFLPWAFLFFARALRGDLRAVFAASACLVSMFLGGGVYPLAISMLFLGLYASLSARTQGSGRAAALLAALGASTLALGAVRVLPAIEYMREFPREPEQPTGFSLQGLGVGLFSRDQRLEVAVTHFPEFRPGEFLRGISADFDDLGMYVGPVVAALFLIGVLARGRAHWKLVALGALFLALSFGDRLPFGPFQLLRELPVFSAMRYAERYRFVWLMCGLLIAGAGLQWLRAELRRRLGSSRGDALAVCLLGLILADQFLVTRPIHRAAFPIPPMPQRAFPEFRQIVGLPNYDDRGFLAKPYGRMLVYGSHSAHYPAFLRNAGFVACYESANVPRGAVPFRSARYRGEVHLRGTSGSVSTLLWSPNRLRYRVRGATGGRLVVNQNFDPHWYALDGRAVSSEEGLLSVAIGPDDGEIELRYARRSLLVGLFISLAACAGVTFLVRRIGAPVRPSA
ncbi:MAG TPA: hypothetical protein VII78_19640 [Myxococcota bacterium]|jgi:hypothetical protein